MWCYSINRYTAEYIYLYLYMCVCVMYVGYPGVKVCNGNVLINIVATCYVPPYIMGDSISPWDWWRHRRPNSE